MKMTCKYVILRFSKQTEALLINIFFPKSKIGVDIDTVSFQTFDAVQDSEVAKYDGWREQEILRIKEAKRLGYDFTVTSKHYR